MLSTYPSCFFKKENGYSVIFPDLNYLVICGETLDEVFAMAVDCLSSYLYLQRKENESTPPPSTMEQINLNDVANELQLKESDGFINIVTVDVTEYTKTHFEISV